MTSKFILYQHYSIALTSWHCLNDRPVASVDLCWLLWTFVGLCWPAVNPSWPLVPPFSVWLTAQWVRSLLPCHWGLSFVSQCSSKATKTGWGTRWTKRSTTSQPPSSGMAGYRSDANGLKSGLFCWLLLTNDDCYHGIVSSKFTRWNIIWFKWVSARRYWIM